MTLAAVRGPLGGEPLGQVQLSDPQAVDRAVTAARAALPRWRARPLAERADLLEAAAATLHPRQEELGDLLAAESGKPLAQARFEVRVSIDFLQANAQVGRRATGEMLPTEGQHGTEDDLAFTRREPLGVIAAILPFNFPVELFVEKCAAALVGGNTVVCKAPAEDPLVVGAFHEALIGAGVPPDALVLLHGGREVGAALAGHDGVDAVSLTGSTAAGIAVAKAAAPRLRRLHLELGGNNAALVLEDADLDLVERELAYGRLLMNGQACAASKRIIVHQGLHDELVDRLRGVVECQVLGAPTDPATTVGPLVTAQAASRVAAQVSAAVADGALLVAGSDAADGPYFAPALLAGTPSTARVAQDEEIFGPAFVVIAAGNVAEAVQVANASSYGLMGSVFTRDLPLALAVAERLEAGGVVINGTDNYRPPILPFGGVKLSGLGREGLGYTLEELTREKAIVFRRLRTARPELEGL